ncbi:MAG TPA: DUF1275 family protein [Phycisphaerales bacterium]|nr:DUF1275 family protein [Phycisphaerales bacterium]HMP37117.1 DUF1275 family protein [Phycisphaerales bacterium]
MFAAPAHSFVQQARLAITLAWVAGYSNIVALIACGSAISHVTGTASQLGRDVGEAAWGLALSAAAILLAFLAGATISGLATELGRRRRWESIYVLPMAIETVLLATFAVGLEIRLSASGLAPAGSIFGAAPRPDPGAESLLDLMPLLLIGSLAMGLQNATITRISGGVVRTTHVTGVLTDLGLEAAQLLWSRVDPGRRGEGGAPSRPGAEGPHDGGRGPLMRLALLGSVLGSFVLGALLGTVVFGWTPAFAMFPPVLFLVVVIVQDLRVPIAEIERSPVASADLGLPEGLAIYHLRPSRTELEGAADGGRSHRLPDLVAWAQRLPPSVRLVVLDVAPMARLGEQAARTLGSLLDRLALDGRRIVLAGIDASRLEKLRSLGAGERLRQVDCCTDFELAVARGICILEEEAQHDRPSE